MKYVVTVTVKRNLRTGDQISTARRYFRGQQHGPA